MRSIARTIVALLAAWIGLAVVVAPASASMEGHASYVCQSPARPPTLTEPADRRGLTAIIHSSHASARATTTYDARGLGYDQVATGAHVDSGVEFHRGPATLSGMTTGLLPTSGSPDMNVG